MFVLGPRIRFGEVRICQNGSVQNRWVVAGSNPAAPTTTNHWAGRANREAITARILAQRSREGELCDQYARVQGVTVRADRSDLHNGCRTDPTGL
jgi:hypothetical protein